MSVRGVVRWDLKLSLRHQAFRPVYRVATREYPVTSRAGRRLLTDLATADGRDDLAQAVVLRLLTPRGELAPLGHPEYGSRLFELVGRENTETTLDLVRLFILESLARERRLTVEELAVSPSPGRRDRVDVSLRVSPRAGDGALAVGPFAIEL